jgi:hypothetical protein
MDDFIVGGFIPGTNIQLPFWVSLIFDTLVFVLLAYAWHKYNKQIDKRLRKLVSICAEKISKLNYFLQPMALSTAHKATILQVNISGYYSHYLEQARQALKNNWPSDWTFRR